MDCFDVSKEKGRRWYVFNTKQPNKPIPGTYRKEKKDALHIAANYMSLPYKQFMKQQKKLVRIKSEKRLTI